MKKLTLDLDSLGVDSFATVPEMIQTAALAELIRERAASSSAPPPASPDRAILTVRKGPAGNHPPAGLEAMCCGPRTGG